MKEATKASDRQAELERRLARADARLTQHTLDETRGRIFWIVDRLDGLREPVGRGKAGRSLSVAITELETGMLWLSRCAGEYAAEHGVAIGQDAQGAGPGGQDHAPGQDHHHQAGSQAPGEVRGA